MLYTSHLLASASGSVGGCCFSRCRGAKYIRRRAYGVDVMSPQQTAVRGAFAYLIGRWSQGLTETQRDGWRTWAMNTPQTNALGQSIRLTGQAAYVRANSLRRFFGEVLIDAAPTVFQNATLTPPTFASATAFNQTVRVAFNNDDPWHVLDDGQLVVSIARPQNASLAAYAASYRINDLFFGGSGSSPSPIAIGMEFAFSAGQRLFGQFRALEPNGNISRLTTATILAT